MEQQNPNPPPTSTTIINFISPNPPPFPSSPRTVDLSPLEFVLALVAVIIIPALIYTFFYSIKCPSCRRSRTSNDSDDFLSNATDEYNINNPNNLNPPNPNPTSLSNKEVVSDVKYSKEIHVKEIGSECPVCLSVFAEGEDVKQLSNCKHSFHSTCIDLWLNSHSNCPVCRASVPVKRPNTNTSATGTNNNGSSSSSRSRRDHTDFHQGLPGAADLV